MSDEEEPDWLDANPFESDSPSEPTAGEKKDNQDPDWLDAEPFNSDETPPESEYEGSDSSQDRWETLNVINNAAIPRVKDGDHVNRETGSGEAEQPYKDVIPDSNRKGLYLYGEPDAGRYQVFFKGSRGTSNQYYAEVRGEGNLEEVPGIVRDKLSQDDQWFYPTNEIPRPESNPLFEGLENPDAVSLTIDDYEYIRRSLESGEQVDIAVSGDSTEGKIQAGATAVSLRQEIGTDFSFAYRGSGREAHQEVTWYEEGDNPADVDVFIHSYGDTFEEGGEQYEWDPEGPVVVDSNRQPATARAPGKHTNVSVSAVEQYDKPGSDSWRDRISF